MIFKAIDIENRMPSEAGGSMSPLCLVGMGIRFVFMRFIAYLVRNRSGFRNSLIFFRLYVSVYVGWARDRKKGSFCLLLIRYVFGLVLGCSTGMAFGHRWVHLRSCL